MMLAANGRLIARILIAAGPRYDGTPTLVVTGESDDNDGVLGRALVRLAT